ncbi:VanZ family protein [Chamaesiphon minutus]|nr:VanZ family protein [Chamaesiphon minutus]
MRLRRWLPFCLFFLFVASIIVGSNVGRLRSITSLVNNLPFGDKCGHLVLIATLTFLLNYALNGRKVKIGRLKILLGGTIVAVAMTVEEISQIWMPLRTFDLIDLSANYLGITLAGLPWLNRNAVVDR